LDAGALRTVHGMRASPKDDWPGKRLLRARVSGDSVEIVIDLGLEIAASMWAGTIAERCQNMYIIDYVYGHAPRNVVVAESALQAPHCKIMILLVVFHGLSPSFLLLVETQLLVLL